MMIYCTHLSDYLKMAQTPQVKQTPPGSHCTGEFHLHACDWIRSPSLLCSDWTPRREVHFLSGYFTTGKVYLIDSRWVRDITPGLDTKKRCSVYVRARVCVF